MERTHRLIAIVDDDPLDRFISKAVIDQHYKDSQLLFFSNGIEIMEYLEMHQQNPARLPDMIFLDIQMPVCDGWMFMNLLSSRDHLHLKKLPIYILSSSIDGLQKMRLQYQTVTGFIEKPLTLKKLENHYSPTNYVL